MPFAIYDSIAHHVQTFLPLIKSMTWALSPDTSICNSLHPTLMAHNSHLHHALGKYLGWQRWDSPDHQPGNGLAGVSLDLTDPIHPAMASNICTFGVMVQTDYSVWCFIYSLGIGSHGITLVIWDDQDCNSILNGIRSPQPNWHKISDWGQYMIKWCWQNVPPKCMLVGGAVSHLGI